MLTLLLCLLLADEPQLLKVHRIYVDRLTGGETAAQIRDMLIVSLQGTGLFTLTENPDKADTFLRGAAEDLVFTESFSSSEGVDVRTAFGRGANSAKTSSSRRSFYTSMGAGENESTHTAERKHEAVAAVRLVNKDGDVVWSTIQESQGGKFRGASSDVADKVAKQLISDYERVRQNQR